ncbi:hypothetical protein ASD45_17580 [Pseudolabrys sp. Root1462]|nr:hypothetical protein ASD45_17580 [Pseudolabrys sp. Root1462]
MRVAKREKSGPVTSAVDGGLNRPEIEADVFEIWIGVSRLMARLTEPSRPRVRHKTRPRRALAAASKPPAPRSGRVIP